MAKLGPKYTGNQAHKEFVEFLASHLQDDGLDLARERYTLPRWEARRCAIMVTPAAGVTGELVYAGHNPSFTLDGLQGKIALVDFAPNVRKLHYRSLCHIRFHRIPSASPGSA
jgi:hypothetical protein